MPYKDKELEKKSSKLRYDTKKALGLCINCGKLPQTEGVFCSECKSKITNRILQRRINRLCTKCGAPAAENKVLCQICTNKANEANRRKVKTRQSKNLCILCGAPSKTKSYCADCHIKEQKRQNCAKYKLSIKDYELMYQKQNGECKICRKPPALGKVLCIDHDHISGKIRGLLCRPCNIVLGFSKDDPTILSNAAMYLIEFKNGENNGFDSQI